MKVDLGISQGFDLYPVLKAQFDADPGATSIDIYLGDDTDKPRLRRITRAEFERERLVRDVHRLNAPIRMAN